MFTSQSIMVDGEKDVLTVLPSPSIRGNDENETRMIFDHLPNSWVKMLRITPL